MIGRSLPAHDPRNASFLADVARHGCIRGKLAAVPARARTGPHRSAELRDASGPGRCANARPDRPAALACRAQSEHEFSRSHGATGLHDLFLLCVPVARSRHGRADSFRHRAADDVRRGLARRRAVLAARVARLDGRARRAPLSGFPRAHCARPGRNRSHGGSRPRLGAVLTKRAQST